MTDCNKRGIKRECDWCNESADINKEIYYACMSHEQNLTDLVDL